MPIKTAIQTQQAPKAIGVYSQAIKAGNTVHISGQIPLDPQTMEIVVGGFPEHCHQVFRNLNALCEEAGGSLAHIVKLTIYLTELKNFLRLNEIMTEYFSEPYPARVVVEVSALPKRVCIEADAMMVLDEGVE